MKKSTGAIIETLLMMNAAWTDDDIISKLRQDFSLMSTMNRTREELKDLKQLPGQPISSYMYKYGRIHFLAMGNQAHNERYPTAIMEFIKSLNPKLMRALVKKHADLRTRPQMLQQAFNMAEEASRRILGLSPSKGAAQCGSQVLPTIFNSVNLRSMKYHEGDTTTITKVVTIKNNYNKGKSEYYGKKDWNKNTKGSYQKKDDKKESKDKDVYLTLTKDIKFHCPVGFDENIFAYTCRMIQEKLTVLGNQV